MRIHDKDFELFLNDFQIRERILVIAQQLNERLANKNPIFIIVLNGAYLFGADLTRLFNGPCEVSFSRIKSYEGVSSGELHAFSGFSEHVNGRHVVIIEDIVDTGKTLFHLVNELNKCSVESITTVALLQKDINRPYLVRADITGFEIEDVFVVGYGLDYNEEGRNLKDVWKII